MGVIARFRAPDRAFVLGWAWASLVANTVIILTGGLVRLTGSGLGCPTWPRCTEDSFVPQGELGIHGIIEFGNRLLTYVLIAVAVATFVAVVRWAGSTPAMRRLVLVMALGIPFQGVIGGITVLTNLNPWIVSLHLILSLGLVTASTVLVGWVRGEDRTRVPVSAHRLVVLAVVLMWVAVYLGTVVTGSGPHAGDADSPRNGLDPAAWSRLHALSVWALVLVTVLVVRAVWSTAARRAAIVLLAVELAQGAIGYVQYLTDLPVALVAAHLVGAAVLVAAATRLMAGVRSEAGARALA
ncbi:cytochrome oxidase assembly protein [Aeromicrobium marinum DSM 15272]|uniref:Cytochrome oxidase assembly protein n=1 Tax=Aeromicrobium marinum DSM 15272 TaxID=585531 RepID=E2SA30_9ACTN|nr:COX15/CtaA family protein [Aeromicrobium marinum]EFQ84104.1 cytochrome oxidase assembly protein [Aeromicrobium marinum DSM 15272]